MSNVTATEILDLTAQTWGVDMAAMCKRRAGISPAGPARRATLAAVWLICKHTETPLLELARLLGYSAWAKGGDTRVVTLHRLAAKCIAEVPAFAARVEIIERMIDTLHYERESRILATLGIAEIGSKSAKGEPAHVCSWHTAEPR